MASAAMSEPNIGRRLVVIGIVIVVMFAGLVTRLWFLQVAGGENLAVAAQRNGDKIVQVPALRGRILDDKGNVLAETVPVTSLTVDRQKLGTADRATLVPNLAKVLNVSDADATKAIDNPKYSSLQPVPVLSPVTDDVAQYVAEHPEDFPATNFSTTFMREYPNGQVGAQLIGYIGRISAQELKLHAGEGYSNDDVIGKAGVEKEFEYELRGTPELKKVRVNNQGLVIGESVVRDAVPGHDVQLTADLGVQKVADESLQQGISGAQGSGYKANAGAVIVLDARTGSVVALDSSPSYDPNQLANGTVDPSLLDPNGPEPLFDRAVSAQLAPGSTFKPFTSIAMLEKNIRSADETYYDNGCISFGNNEQRCNDKKNANGIVDLARALTVSSDVYFYQVGKDIWAAYQSEGGDAKTGPNDHPVGYAIQNVASQFGFGKDTGSGLTGELDGRIPDLAFNQALNKSSPDPTSRTWRQGDSASLAVGQGDLLVTPLQLANAYAAFENGGTLYTPRLASAVRANGASLTNGQLGAIAHTIDPAAEASNLLPADVRAQILPGLIGAVNSGEGTAYFPFVGYQGPTVAGKTGTAQNGNEEPTSWFVGMTNPDNDPNQPQYVVLAMVEQGGYGADVAAPIVRRVIDYLATANPNLPPVQVGGASAHAHD
jgi:penicillin-binding protein 2